MPGQLCTAHVLVSDNVCIASRLGSSRIYRVHRDSWWSTPPTSDYCTSRRNIHVRQDVCIPRLVGDQPSTPIQSSRFARGNARVNTVKARRSALHATAMPGTRWEVHRVMLYCVIVYLAPHRHIRPRTVHRVNVVQNCRLSK